MKENDAVAKTVGPQQDAAKPEAQAKSPENAKTTGPQVVEAENDADAKTAGPQVVEAENDADQNTLKLKTAQSVDPKAKEEATPAAGPTL